MVIKKEKYPVARESAGLGRPLRVPTFRNLLIADLVSDIGTFMQSVGAAWLMVSMHAGPGKMEMLMWVLVMMWVLVILFGALLVVYFRKKERR